jgi:hypothetical protein
VATTEVRAATFEAMRHVASFKEVARAVNPGFDTMRPWPFLLLYHSWFQSAAPSAGGEAPDSAPQPAPDTGFHDHRSRGRRPANPVAGAEQLRLWAKRGEPGLVVSHDRTGAAMNYNPTFYARDTMAETLHGYTAVLEALLADPYQRIADLKLG